MHHRTDPMASPQHVSDDDRRRIAEEIAAALLLIYAGKRQQALAQLGREVATGDLPPDAVATVQAFADDRAQKIQDGVNSRMDGSDDPTATAHSIDEYNATVLLPFLQSWASHRGTLDAYQETPGQTPGSTAATDRQWLWAQQTDFEDDCSEAAAASPASLDDLLSITGAPPPVHERCQCTLAPAD